MFMVTSCKLYEVCICMYLVGEDTLGFNENTVWYCCNTNETNPSHLTIEICPATINAEMFAIAHQLCHLPCIAFSLD